ncbi:MAG: dTMP kinase [Candidatus Portnoybacteria bacterium CG23_combo_of_CG06-09_8_20_14_all_37_13]|uniref:Thymidylate kinase n=1 Tax=Candidatus Portnoybacteria bacterium CG23_combo_of_CG06-09_8_20_14_all_37_13 TaxID=1974819 RepID=A0A2G9YC88_9BACT|nr:MAG: dTMP kinase [Candidatus Portnoybacteria bacterium CG23_combo_of_CG06-09_8_20_14_all_37_13]
MIKNSYPGKFIVFEGLDGSGQSTQTKFLKDFLGNKAVLTKEPRSENKIIKDALASKKKLAPKILQELFAQDREEHLGKEIIPALEKGKTVICDRYAFSSFAYGSANNVPIDYLLEINKDFLMPDIVFFLDTPPPVCLKRVEKRGDKKTLFEKKKILAKVYENYKCLSRQFNFIKINGKKNIEKVFEQVRSHYRS